MGDYFRFRVQLAEVQPPIFRQFLLTTKATFYDLHMAIQDACGWQNCHLFVFHDKKRQSIAGLPDNSDFGAPDPDAKKVKLAAWFSLTQNSQCIYHYDFGDSWVHEVTLELIEQHDGKWKRRLIDGARAFPPEDCGGIPGYFNCAEVASTGEDSDGVAEWLGDWKPENFDQIGTKRRFDK